MAYLYYGSIRVTKVGQADAQQAGSNKRKTLRAGDALRKVSEGTSTIKASTTISIVVGALSIAFP